MQITEIFLNISLYGIIVGVNKNSIPFQDKNWMPAVDGRRGLSIVAPSIVCKWIRRKFNSTPLLTKNEKSSP